MPRSTPQSCSRPLPPTITPGLYVSLVPADNRKATTMSIHTDTDRGREREREIRAEGCGRCVRACDLELDAVVVGDHVDEADEGDLVGAKPPAARADALDGDRAGGQRRQHQPLPEVPAAGEPPRFVPSHPRRRPETMTMMLPFLLRSRLAGERYFLFVGNRSCVRRRRVATGEALK